MKNTLNIVNNDMFQGPILCPLQYENTFMGSSAPSDAIKGTEPRYEDERQREIIIERRK